MKSRKQVKRSGKAQGRRLSSSLSKPNDLHDNNSPAYSEDGVDLTLIRWMLSLTPAERLQVLQQNANAIAELRNANPHL
jgi:hypothetical protein